MPLAGKGENSEREMGGLRVSARRDPEKCGLTRRFGRPESDANEAYSVAVTVPGGSILVIDVILSFF